MAIILNIETATTVCSVSLAKDTELLSLKEINGDYSHAENLTLFIEDVCKQANVKLSDVDAIAVSKGPGSYTGLRIGVSTAKGLCYSLEKPLIAINTLQHLADGLPSHFTSRMSEQPQDVSKFSFSISALPILYCPMIDARRMEVYCALYDSAGNEIRQTTAKIIDEHSFSDLFEKNQLFFFGDGATKCKEVLSKNKNAIFIDNIVPSAKDMIRLSSKAFGEKQFEDVAYFEPFYLKDFVAGKKKGES
jgi:tRNA threonylcarbamoyladenosine biosynthesis protein TsaB